MTDAPKRLIETAFPLEQVSLDSVHEKNVRHGHISTLHIWPARRPLAACRAALIASLLPDAAGADERRAIYRRMAGRVVETVEDVTQGGRTVARRKRSTRGGILHWKREDGPDLDWFRERIREAWGGRAPRVLDPFAGGGAIPLEAMRLGCEATAVDVNPVAWFVLTCTLDWPRKLAGQTRPLPAFVRRDRAFMTAFLQANGVRGRALTRELAALGLDARGKDAGPPAPTLVALGLDARGKDAGPAVPTLAALGLDARGSYAGPAAPTLIELADEHPRGRHRGKDAGPAAPTLFGPGVQPVRSRSDRRDAGPAAPTLIEGVPAPDADLAWQVRAWGRRVLAAARRRLARRYPTWAEFRALKPGGRRFKPRARRLLTPDADGAVDAAALNREFDAEYLDDQRNPRWVATPTVAYLWARTARCKGCRATIPLLKTRWLAKKGAKRVRLTMTPNEDGTGVVFGVEAGVPVAEETGARQREHDRELGGGTMNRSGARCPCCGAIATMEDLRVDGRAGRLGAVMTAVVVDGPTGKEYRLPTEEDLDAARVDREDIEALYAEIPFGVPSEPTPKAGVGASRAFSIDGYGFTTWRSLFTDRQLLALGTFVQEVRRVFESEALDDCPATWRRAVAAYLAPTVSRLADRGSTLATWTNDPEKVRGTFARFALPMVWDFVEVCPLADSSGGFVQAVEWSAEVCEHLSAATAGAPAPVVRRESAAEPQSPGEAAGFDLICTDPPYYDAIPYSDLMDFFHVWLRRVLHGLSPAADGVFADPLGPKWDADAGDGELIDDAARFGGDRAASKRNYEDGMARAFTRFHAALQDDGRLVLVFANKSPDAWETLVSALIRAGFVVTGSWPIQTERLARARSLASAALASSIWLVCRKRTRTGPGWDATVLAEMRQRIHQQLRDFWDAGIRGPDFVWAATGPALEAFSRHPVVKCADAPGARLSVSAFLREVRRFVVDFVVGRVLTAGGEEMVSGLDDVTTYYLLHRYDFGLGDAPAGACILYALSCNLSDRALADRHDLLAHGGGRASDEPDDEDDEYDGASGEADGDDAQGGADSAGRGGTVRLKPWNRRRAKTLGADAQDGAPAPLIDQAHRLMQLWRGGDESKVNDYLDARGLTRNALFGRLLQAVIELAPAGSEERAILESLSNHVAARSGVSAARQPRML